MNIAAQWRGGTATVTAKDMNGNDLPYQANNSEVVAILMAWTNFPNGTPAPSNPGNIKNPQREVYLAAATVVASPNLPGIGPDGVYRDPWGNPYIISFDLTNDEKTRDGFYRDHRVSQNTGQAGFFGLYNSTDPSGMTDAYEASTPVMVWSAGPDKMIETGKANQGANKDNVLGWKY
jgi:hypothetical protein